MLVAPARGAGADDRMCDIGLPSRF